MRTRKWSIADLMWIVFFVAIGLGLARGGPEVDWLAQYWFLVLLGAMVLRWIWFIVVPRWSLRLARRDRRRQRWILQCVVNTPLPGKWKALARYLLAVNYQAARRYDEAEALFRSILRDAGKRLDSGFESLLRQHLADTVEALGRGDEARAERELAMARLEGAEETFLSLQARGKLLERQNRHAEAVAAFERALVLSPPGEKAVQVQMMMHLVDSTSHAGRPADTLRWAEAVIGFDPHSHVIPLAHRLAAVASSSLGRFDDAERHARAAVELSRTPEQRAAAIGLLADYVMRRGDLHEAERLAREAEATCPGKDRMPWIIIAHLERAGDRPEAAIQALETAKARPISHIPAVNRRADATIDKNLAIYQAELGRRDIALDLIARAEAELAGDPKLLVQVVASAALVHALLGERDRSLARIDSAERGRHALAQDGTTQQAVLSLLGWAALAIDEPARAEAFLREFLALRPDPLHLPFAWYHLGGCRRRLGDEAGGREWDARAASTRLGTRWERRARERLATEGVPV
jgi:tetratricopeptide (TPR) repeat protein